LFCQNRISNSIPLNIEKGRHLKIPVEQRICPLCKQIIEDEYHVIMKCQNLDELRNKLCDEIISVVPHFSAMNNTEKFNFISSSQDLDISKILVISVFNMYNLNKSLKGM
jgi:acetamidase/formamidase